jgi:hypothetical protein
MEWRGGGGGGGGGRRGGGGEEFTIHVTENIWYRKTAILIVQVKISWSMEMLKIFLKVLKGRNSFK